MCTVIAYLENPLLVLEIFCKLYIYIKGTTDKYVLLMEKKFQGHDLLVAEGRCKHFYLLAFLSLMYFMLSIYDNFRDSSFMFFYQAVHSVYMCSITKHFFALVRG